MISLLLFYILKLYAHYVYLGYLEAINITAIAGDKGKDPYTCQVLYM